MIALPGIVEEVLAAAELFPGVYWWVGEVLGVAQGVRSRVSVRRAWSVRSAIWVGVEDLLVIAIDEGVPGLGNVLREARADVGVNSRMRSTISAGSRTRGSVLEAIVVLESGCLVVGTFLRVFSSGNHCRECAFTVSNASAVDVTCRSYIMPRG